MVSLTVVSLAACTKTASTVVCWQEPIAQIQRDVVFTDKYDPLPAHDPLPAMQTICVPLPARLPDQPPVPGEPGTPAGPGPGPGPSTRDTNAQTYRDSNGGNSGTLAVGETVAGTSPIAGTDRRDDAPRTYAGTLDAIKTGDSIRNEVSGLGDQIRQGVDSDVR
jgi:hypothetical protein